MLAALMKYCVSTKEIPNIPKTPVIEGFSLLMKKVNELMTL